MNPHQPPQPRSRHALGPPRTHRGTADGGMRAGALGCAEPLPLTDAHAHSTGADLLLPPIHSASTVSRLRLSAREIRWAYTVAGLRQDRRRSRPDCHPLIHELPGQGGAPPLTAHDPTFPRSVVSQCHTSAPAAAHAAALGTGFCGGDR